jgi:hypothetical protein
VRFRISFIVVCLLVGQITPVSAAQPIDLKYNRSELEAKWAARIRFLLDQGKLPKIDMGASGKKMAQAVIAGAI